MSSDVRSPVVRASDGDWAGRAMQVLQRGGCVAFPTDTVYGVGALPSIRTAVAHLYQIKTRPQEKAIPLLAADLSALARVTSSMPDMARQLAAAFLPGGLTLILPKASWVPPEVSPTDTVAVRIPDHPIALALLRAAGGVLAVTSANRSGQESAATAEDALEQLDGRVDLIIDGGRCPGGVVSTIVDVTGPRPRVLRQGAISLEALRSICGADLEAEAA